MPLLHIRNLIHEKYFCRYIFVNPLVFASGFQRLYHCVSEANSVVHDHLERTLWEYRNFFLIFTCIVTLAVRAMVSVCVLQRFVSYRLGLQYVVLIGNGKNLCKWILIAALLSYEYVSPWDMAILYLSLLFCYSWIWWNQ